MKRLEGFALVAETHEKPRCSRSAEILSLWTPSTLHVLSDPLSTTCLRLKTSVVVSIVPV